jgi:hypothetical protein
MPLQVIVFLINRTGQNLTSQARVYALQYIRQP